MVVFVRSTYSEGQVEVGLVASKARVAPIKRQTIPRLEQLGAIILSRLVSKLKSLGTEIPVVLWTDSMTTLCWIKNERAWKQYVGLRVDEIRRLTPKESWRHCTGEVNPADIPSQASRGLTAKELLTCKTWWNGPKFLQDSSDEWPASSHTNQIEEEEILQEAIKNEPIITHSMINSSLSNVTGGGICNTMNIDHYSNITRLLRVTAYVVRFIKNIKTNDQSERNLEEPRADELKDADILWVKSFSIRRRTFLS